MVKKEVKLVARFLCRQSWWGCQLKWRKWCTVHCKTRRESAEQSHCAKMVGMGAVVALRLLGMAVGSDPHNCTAQCTGTPKPLSLDFPNVLVRTRPSQVVILNVHPTYFFLRRAMHCGDRV
jgi:hypothetical protein